MMDDLDFKIFLGCVGLGLALIGGVILLAVLC